MRIVPLSLTMLLAAIGAAAAEKPACESLASAGLFKATTVTAARHVAADESLGLAAHCEVTAVIAPVPGSHIGVVYRLPDAWNEKLLGLGGAGWAGVVHVKAAAPALARGYATAQTDGGHEGAAYWETSWAAKPEAVTDFAWRAIHLMTLVGKDVVARYYGRPQSRAYFQGCSTGGRQGMMEAQRFPEDYDGIIAGAPVHTLLTQTSALLRNLAFAAPGAALGPEQIAHLHEAALAACDALDGLKDGIVTDPRACQFDPAAIACSAGAPSANCLTAAQVAAVRSAYDGVRTADGRIASYPLARGSELAWPIFIDVGARFEIGTGATSASVKGLRALFFNNRDFDLRSFDPEKHLRTVRTSAFARSYEAQNPNITAFVQRGGKLLLWHGFDDPGPSPLATIEYYDAAQRALAPAGVAATGSVRLFVAPGVQHCGGGPGADVFDTLRALDDWVLRKQPPELMHATRADGRLSRPLCRYPALPYYKGPGGPNDASSFDCR
jgi:feruloyl esterase